MMRGGVLPVSSSHWKLEGEPQEEGPVRTPSCSMEVPSHSRPVQSPGTSAHFDTP